LRLNVRKTNVVQ